MQNICFINTKLPCIAYVIQTILNKTIKVRNINQNMHNNIENVITFHFVKNLVFMVYNHKHG